MQSHGHGEPAAGNEPEQLVRSGDTPGAGNRAAEPFYGQATKPGASLYPIRDPAVVGEIEGG